MPGNDMFKIVFSLLIAGIVIYQLSFIPDFFAKVEISFIAGLSAMLLFFAFFSIFNKVTEN